MHVTEIFMFAEALTLLCSLSVSLPALAVGPAALRWKSLLAVLLALAAVVTFLLSFGLIVWLRQLQLKV